MNNKKESFWPMMITVFMGTFAVMLSSSTINIALPFLMQHFHTDLDHVKWTMTGFMLAMGTTAPLTAFFGEKFSYKRLYIVSSFGFTIASLLAVFSGNIYFLIGVRILQGCFGGVTLPATMALIYQIVPKEKQVLAISLWNISPMLAPAIGPSASGFLIQYFSWHGIFVINVILGLITIILAVKYIPFYKLSATFKFDFNGILFSLLSSASFLFAFSEGSVWGWFSYPIIVLLVVGTLTMIIFIYHELHTNNPALDLHVFKYPKFLFGLIVGIIINIALFSGSLITPIYLQQIQGMTPLQAGLLMFPPSLMMAIAMPITGKIYNKIGGVPIAVAGILMVAIGTFQMSHLAVNTSAIYIIGWMTVRYVGLAVSSMPVNYICMAVLPKELAGHASSILNWIKQIFSCLAIGVFSSLLTIRMSYHTATILHQNSSIEKATAELIGSVLGVNDVYFISCVIILISLPFIFFLHSKRKNVEL